MDAQTSGSIESQVRLVTERIADAARRSGRAADAVRLVAATKSVSVERIRDGIAAGLRVLGENRLQEALPKIQALGGEPVQWHFIGALQRRKVRDVVGRFELIHSVDTIGLAEEIDRRAQAAGLTQAVLLEVNVGGEKTKAGFRSDELEQAVPFLKNLAHIEVKGLMTIPPPASDPELTRPHFRALRDLALALSRQLNVSMTELSMGMSNDFVVAVEEGATMVRVGAAIFGERHA